jgi:hypothetical protein
MSTAKFFDEDLDIFFDPDDFAEEAILISPETGDEESFLVIYDDVSQDHQTGAGILVAGGPKIFVKSLDVERLNLHKGDIIIIDDRKWILSSPARIESHGVVSYKLQESNDEKTANNR